MIQGLNLLNSKATAGKESVDLTNELANALAIDPELALEQMDFANELQGSMKMDELLMAEVQLPEGEAKTATDAKIKSVLTPEALLAAPMVGLKGLENLNSQLPSDIVKQLPSLQPEAEGVKAKLVDPSITKDVNKLMDPKLSLNAAPSELEAAGEVPSEISKLTKDQIQTILAAPMKGEASRSPAIDFAPSEIDPQLMKSEDFMLQRQQKNSKKMNGGEAYGRPKNTQVKELEVLDLKKTQTVGDAALVNQSATSAPSQDFILGLMSEAPVSPKGMEVQQSSTQKVFDMGQIKTSNSQEIMNQISDYIVQAKAAKEPTVSLKVDHKDFGQMDIVVSRLGTQANAENIAINIATSSPEIKALLQQHKGELFTTLAQSGMNVTDFKVDSASSRSGSDFNSNSNGSNSNQFAGSEKQFGSESNQRRHEQNRRADLWDLLKDKAAA